MSEWEKHRGAFTYFLRAEIDNVMRDNAKMHAALERICNEEHDSDCPMVKHAAVTPGGFECGCPSLQAARALKSGGAR